MSKESSSDPLEFVRSMWSNMGFTLPGMVTPTLDVDELEQRITDMKAVEGWLRMNLSMLQASIQGLEVQAATLSTIRAMGEAVTYRAPDEPAKESAELANPFSAAALWPWMQATSAAPTEGAEQEAPAAPPAAEEAAPKENAATAAGANAAEAFASAASAASSAAIWPWQMLGSEAAKAATATPGKKATAKKPAGKKAPAKKHATSASAEAKPAAAGTAKRTTPAPAGKRAPAKKS